MRTPAPFVVPLSVRRPHPDWWQVVDATGKVVFDDGSSNGEYNPKCTEEARDRIIACVNFCKGLDPNEPPL